MNLFDFVKEKIDNSKDFQPILFLWSNKSKVEIELNNLISKMFDFYSVDKNNIFKLEDNSESIKIETLRNFIAKSNIKSSFKFQIFLIENISRLTLQSWNASLKFLEEPWVWNIIFLTNNSESWVLDTILSRVLKINISWEVWEEKSEFYYSMIDNYFKENSKNIFYYFFDDKKFEKKDYIEFFKTFLFYIKKNLVMIDLLPEIEKNLNLIENWNPSLKYLVDRFLIKLI